MQRKTKLLLTFLSALMSINSATAADIFTLKLYHIDDDMKVYISNAFYHDQNILNVGFGNSYPIFDLTSFVKPGENTLELQLFNGPAGWTYGYDFQKNGITISAGECGNFNIRGCNNDEYKQGLVWTKSITFNAYGNVPAHAVPEPATWMLFIIGFVGVGAVLRRGRKKHLSPSAIK